MRNNGEAAPGQRLLEPPCAGGISCARGLPAASLAMIRGFIRKETENLGNFWVDLTRSTIYILLPFSIIVALILTFQGVPQTLSPYMTVQTIEGNTQNIAIRAFNLDVLHYTDQN